MFQLTWVEALQRSRSQTVTLKRGQNIRYLPYAFTEHGAIMAANVLNSPRATQMSVFVVRAFVKMRATLSDNRDKSTGRCARQRCGGERMKGLLVRVGVDQSERGGFWNAPVDRRTGELVYVSIPEDNSRRGLEKPYNLVDSALAKFHRAVPDWLQARNMHLDPDFNHLTYRDQGQRARQIREKLGRGDLLVFYAGLRDIVPESKARVRSDRCLCD